LRWARHEQGAEQDRARSAVVTPTGAIVFGGLAFGEAVFWTGQPDQRTIPLPAPEGSMFLARASSSGTLTWLRTAGNSGGASVDAMAAIGEDVLVAGGFGYGTQDVILGAGEPSETHLKQNGMFLARYRSDGSLAWARPTGGNAFVTTTELASTPEGGAVAVGQFDFSPIFGPGESKATTLVHSGGNNSGFIARFEPDGSLSWALPIHDAESVTTYDYHVAVRPDGTILLGLWYNGTLTLPGNGGTGKTLTPSPAGPDGFALASYDSAGKLQWARTTGGPAWVHVYGLVLLADGGILANGLLQPAFGAESDPTLGQVIFGPGESNQTTLSASIPTGYVAKFAADGQLLWARQAPGAFFGTNSLAELPDHRVVTAGTFGNYVGLPMSATFGPKEPGQIVLSWFPGTTVANGMYTFLAWYNGDGTISDARTIGTAQGTQVTGVAATPDQGVAICGAFSTQMTFGPTDPSLVSYAHGTMAAQITQDAYLAKFSQ